jgi:hypothetical protein
MTDASSIPDYDVATAEQQFAVMQRAISGWEKEVLNDANRRFFEKRLKIPQALVDHPNSASWVIIWDYLDGRSWGSERKKMIVDLINKNLLDNQNPHDFTLDLDQITHFDYKLKI